MTHLQRVCLSVFMTSAVLSATGASPRITPADTTDCEAGQNCPQAVSQDIIGTILIKKKLTRPNVTASISMYQRGTPIELGKDTAEDPLAFERSRVVLTWKARFLPTPHLSNPRRYR